MNQPPAPVGLAHRASRTMRDSGVEWIGQVPEGWRVERLQWHLEEVVEKNDPVVTTNVLSLTNDRGVIPYAEKGNIGNKAKEDYSQYKLAYPDMIVANSMNILIGSVGLSKYYGCISPVYYVFKIKPNNSIRFFDYLFQMPSFQKELRRYANGILEIRLRVSAIDILKRLVAVPGFAEQERIAAYLDTRCGEIEAAVVAARQSIEDYKVLKKSLVFELVTGKRKVSATLTQRTQSAQRDAGSVGADVLGRPPGCEADRINRIYRIESEMPAAANAKNAKIRKDGDETLRSFANSAFSASAPAGSQNPVNPVNPVEETSRHLRDSGVAWIGQVPEGWEIVRIVSLYREVSERGEDSLPILSVSINTGVSDKELSDEEQERVFVRSEDRSKYKRVQPGDLTYNMMRAWQGAFGAVRVNGMVSPAYVVARPKVEVSSRYVEYLLRTPNATQEMKRYSHGIMDFRLRLYWPEFKNIKLPLPPLSEQRAIADYLDEKCGAIEALVAEKESLIADLEQYKKSLIFECVTGKREVA